MNAAPRSKIIPSPVRCAAMLIGAAILCTAFAPAASAQSGWNRAVQAVSITPNATNPLEWDVTGVLQVHLEEPFTFPLDLSMTVELSVNGTVVASNTHTVGGDPGGSSCPDGAGCGGNCGSGSVDGLPQALLCVPAGPCNPLCVCHCAFPPITSGFPSQSLQPEDEIMVLLRPAPGALPDSDESDDFQIATFESTPIFWDHQVTGLELVPSSAGPGMWDVGVEGAVVFNGMAAFGDPAAGTVPLGFEIELLVAGIPVHTETFDFAPTPSSGGCGCGEICGSYNGFPLGCLLSWNGYCSCGWNWLTNVPSVPAGPGDVIEVILRPVPGALPELPGFEDDDDWLEVCCPGATGIDDSIAISEIGRLEQNRPNPFDRSTTIAFGAASDAHVTLEVFDVRGRRVRTLVDGTVEGSSGPRNVTWSCRTDGGERVPAGIYFYRLTTDGRTETRKMVLTR